MSMPLSSTKTFLNTACFHARPAQAKRSKWTVESSMAVTRASVALFMSSGHAGKATRAADSSPSRHICCRASHPRSVATDSPRADARAVARDAAPWPNATARAAAGPPMQARRAAAFFGALIDGQLGARPLERERPSGVGARPGVLPVSAARSRVAALGGGDPLGGGARQDRHRALLSVVERWRLGRGPGG